MKIEIQIMNEQTDTNHILLGLCGDFCFDSSPIFGARYINKFSIDIIPNENSLPIIVSDNSRFFSDEFNRLSTSGSLQCLKSIILIPNPNDQFFIEQDGYIIFNVDLSNIIDLKNKTNIYWKFTFKDDIFDSKGHLITLENNIIDAILKFKCDRDLYYDFLQNYSLNEPIFFQIFEVI